MNLNPPYNNGDRLLKYDEKTLKHLQKVQLMMLKDLIKICDDNNITYFLDSGTLLGAIRHGGFIPWDDDIDIIMFRKDFEKLNSIMDRNDEKYDFFNVLNENTYFYTWGRFTLKNTLFKEWWAEQVDYTPNIFIDILILDNIPNNKLKRYFHLFSGFMLNQLTLHAYLKFENTSKVKQVIQQTMYYVLKILPISPYSIKKKCVQAYKRYENEECDDVCQFPSASQLPIFSKSDFLPPKRAKFEDIEANIPNNYDVILKRHYGDYMKLPPIESRFRKAPEKIDFGEY